MLIKWYEQLERDCPKDKIPVLFWKANGKELLCFLKTTNGLLSVQNYVAKFCYTGLLNDASIFEYFEDVRRQHILMKDIFDSLPLLGVYYVTDDIRFFVIKAADLLEYRIKDEVLPNS